MLHAGGIAKDHVGLPVELLLQHVHTINIQRFVSLRCALYNIG